MSTKKYSIFLLFLLLIILTCYTYGRETVRKSILAGTWYPESKSELDNEVSRYLAKADPKAPAGRIIGLISPHAGYQYSGQAAAFGYKLLEKNQDITRVIILAPSHHWGFRGASILDVENYETPLGQIPVDLEVVDKLRACTLISNTPYAHLQEHSLEIQLPFLQKVLKSFKLVPVVIGFLNGDDYRKLADALKPFFDEHTLVVASSDFTHFGYNFSYTPFNTNIKENLATLDGGAVEKIINKDFKGFRAYIDKTGITICGREPISVLLKMLPPDAVGTKLVYYTSGDLTGDFSSTVSYVSLVFTVSGAQKTEKAAAQNPEKN